MSDGYVNLRREDLKLSPSMLVPLISEDISRHITDALWETYADADALAESWTHESIMGTIDDIERLRARLAGQS